jgi:hypothetical protein
MLVGLNRRPGNRAQHGQHSLRGLIVWVQIARRLNLTATVSRHKEIGWLIDREIPAKIARQRGLNFVPGVIERWRRYRRKTWADRRRNLRHESWASIASGRCK